MVIGIVWALVILALGMTAIWRIDHYAKEALKLQESRQDSKEKDRAVERLERQNKAEMEAATLEERTELARSELIRQSAEARAAAGIAEGTVQDRITEEQQIIAARAEGRALAAKERAITEGAGNGRSAMELLADLYQAYLNRLPAGTSASSIEDFEDWAGDAGIQAAKV